MHMLPHNLKSVVHLIQAVGRMVVWEDEDVLQAEALADVQTKHLAKLFCSLDLEARLCKIQNEFVLALIGWWIFFFFFPP